MLTPRSSKINIRCLRAVESGTSSSGLCSIISASQLATEISSPKPKPMELEDNSMELHPGGVADEKEETRSATPLPGECHAHEAQDSLP